MGGHKAPRVVPMLALLGALASCVSGVSPPVDPAEQRRWETGCRPQDTVGYERATPYCDSKM